MGNLVFLVVFQNLLLPCHIPFFLARITMKHFACHSNQIESIAIVEKRRNRIANRTRSQDLHCQRFDLNKSITSKRKHCHIANARTKYKQSLYQNVIPFEKDCTQIVKLLAFLYRTSYFQEVTTLEISFSLFATVRMLKYPILC